MPKPFRILIIILSLAILSCEIDTRVTLDGKNPPSFRVSGSGGINFLRVVDMTECRESFLDCPIVWQIDPNGGGVSIADLPLITYGQVPEGFHQKIPANGASAPALVEGRKYNVYTPTYRANGGGAGFMIIAGKSVELR